MGVGAAGVALGLSGPFQAWISRLDARRLGWARAWVRRRASWASLSRFLCKLIYGWLGQVGVDAVGVGQGEGAEGLFPALDNSAFDQPSWGAAVVGG